MKYYTKIPLLAIAVLLVAPIIVLAQEPGAAESYVLGLKDLIPVFVAGLIGLVVSQFNKRVLSTVWGKKAYEFVPDSVKSPVESWLKLLLASGVATGVGFVVAFLTPLAQHLDASGQTAVIGAVIGTSAYGYILESGKKSARDVLSKLDAKTLAAVVAAAQRAR